MISIIVPVLDEAATIGATLEHLSHLEGNYEVIVVDGGSCDETVAIVDRFQETHDGGIDHLTGQGPRLPEGIEARCKLVHSLRGRARQMNYGAEEAGGEILLFLHADTRLPSGALASIERTLSDSTVIGGRFKVALSNEGWVYQLIALGINARDRAFHGFTGDQAIFVRAGTFLALGGYREMPLMEDLDFGYRMSRAGTVARIPSSVETSARRWEKDGVLKTILRMWSLRLLFTLGLPSSYLKRFYGETR